MSVNGRADGFSRFSRHDSQAYMPHNVTPSAITPPGGLTIPASPTFSASTDTLHSRVNSPVQVLSSTALVTGVAANYLEPPLPSPVAMTPSTHVRGRNLSTGYDAKEAKLIQVGTSDPNSKEVAALQAKLQKMIAVKKREAALEEICSLLAKPELDDVQAQKLTNARAKIEDVEILSLEQAERLLEEAKKNLELMRAEKRDRIKTGFVLLETDIRAVAVARDEFARNLKVAASLSNEQHQRMARDEAIGKLDIALKSVQPQEGVAAKAEDDPAHALRKSSDGSACSCSCVIM